MKDANDASSGTGAPQTKWVWRCKVCGFIEDGYPDGLPENYTCPICGNGPKKFQRVEVPIDTPRGL